MAKQHFVPRFLLKSFAVDSDKMFFNIHLLNNNRFLYNKPIYEQAQNDNLYGANQKLENSFGMLESLASPCFVKLNTGNNNLTKEEQYIVKLFLINQYIRTPSFLSMQKDCFNKINEKMIYSNDKEWKKQAEAFNKILNDPYMAFYSQSRNLLNLISDLHIGLLGAESNKSYFMIGQNPVIVLNPFLKEKNSWIWFTQGFELKGLTMIMPISPKFSVILFDNLRYSLLNKNPKWIINSIDVDKLNSFQYCNTNNCIYFSNEINEEYYKKKNNIYRNYREGNKNYFNIVGSSIDERTGYKLEITQTGIKEFPIEQKFDFIKCKAIEYIKPIDGYKDAKREHIDKVNSIRKQRITNKK